MSKFDFNQMRKELFDSINSFIEKKISSIESKLKTIEQKFSEIKVINGVDGKDGRDGVDGKDATVDYDFITKQVRENVVLDENFVKSVSELLPVPKDGKDAEIDYEKVNTIIINHVDSDEFRKVFESSTEKFVEKIKEANQKFKEPKEDTRLEWLEGKFAEKSEAIDLHLKSIPIPKDGVDGKDAVVDYEKLTKSVAESLQTSEYLLNSIVGAVPKPENGKDGIDGKSITIDDVKPMIDDLFKSIPVPENGKDGTSVSLEEVVEHLLPSLNEKIDEKINSIPKPKDGIDGVDGKSISVQEVVEEIFPELESKIESVAKDYLQSEDFIKTVPTINGTDGKDGQNGENGLDGKDGRDGIDGIDGKDALQIEVLDLIEPEKSYPRNTYAHFNGGLVRSYKATDPLNQEKGLEKCGWHVVVNGISSFEIIPTEFDNIFNFSIKTTNGKESVQSISFPYMVYKGIWQEGEYSKNETTTYGGNLWICQVEKTSSKPADGNDDWKIAVRKGRDGRDGLKGEKGDRGAEGRAGKDHYG